jgi:branched-chain amino acid transport system ATP-binding protein
MVVAATYGGGTDVDIERLLKRAGLDDFRDREAGRLNSSQQKLLDIARALATSPKLMLVDEIAAGLNPKELSWLAEWLLELSATGIALLVVEHLIPFLQLVTTRVVVMDVGSVIFEGDIASATRDDHVIEVFLGRGK